MKLISHRGNLENIVSAEENSPQKILYCISQKYDVEIDVWCVNNNFFLGHDYPQYNIDFNFLLNNSNNLWCHAKNLNALNFMLQYQEINCFWHQNDDYTLTSKKNIWVYPGKTLIEGSVVVLPEKEKYTTEEIKICYGICSDQIEKYKIYR